jgi:choline dehydrogenase
MYDVVIVGAGSAGCVLAGRLTEDPRIRVLVLEAGPIDRKLEIRIPAAFAKLFKTPYDWDYATAPEDGLDGRELYWPRGRTLGGSSSINAQMYLRGRPADFDAWALPGWSWEQVRPLFARMENDQRGRLGRGGPVHIATLRDTNPATHAFVRAAVEVGLELVEDVNDPVHEGVGYTPVTPAERAAVERGRRLPPSGDPPAQPHRADGSARPPGALRGHQGGGRRVPEGRRRAPGRRHR